MPPKRSSTDSNKLDRIVAAARHHREQREQGYREQALRLFPWVCGRCGREFTYANLHELTVHHKNHDHDCNPPDGSNWELLCLYCHDNEHSRHLDATGHNDTDKTDRSESTTTYKPFVGLEALLKRKE